MSSIGRSSTSTAGFCASARHSDRAFVSTDNRLVRTVTFAPSTVSKVAGRHAQRRKRLVEALDDERPPPSLRLLIGGVQFRQQLQIGLRDNVDPLAVRERLRKVPALGDEI